MITSPAVIRVATRVLRVAPVGAMRRAARVAGSTASLFLRARRRAVLESLSYLRPDLTLRQRRRLARRTFANFAAASIDLLRLPAASREELATLVSFTGLEHLDAALARGRGAIVVTAHLGPYELGGACLAARGYPASAVAEDLGPEVMQALSTFREATGMRVISLERAVIGTFRALKENTAVLLVADRLVGRGTTGVELPFASGVRTIPVGPATFAISSGAPIIIAHIVRTTDIAGAHYAAQLDPPIFAETGDGQESDRIELTRRITDRLAELIVAHADEWYVFQPEWQVTRGG
ncbi:MAG: lysophospholipid acyltransferase family protein [Gemmatimonadaceae bacterium]